MRSGPAASVAWPADATRFLAVRLCPGDDLSDPDGRVTGGHLLAGCTVRTTAEVVIGLARGVRFTRPMDDGTGHAELAFDIDGDASQGTR